MSYIINKEFLIEVEKSNIPGHSMIHKFGRNDAVSSGSWEHVSLTPFSTANFRTSPIAMRVKAGNANDTAAGNGAREVTIQGIDSNFNEVSEAVATAGESASANTSATFWRVHRAWVSAAGTYTAANTAAIVIEDSGGGADFMTIGVEEGQSQYTGWTTPINKTAYLLSLHISVDSATNKEADVRIFTRENIDDVSAPMSSKRLKLFFDGIEGGYRYYPKGPEFIINAKADLWAEARGDTNNTQVSVDFELLVVDD